MYADRAPHPRRSCQLLQLLLEELEISSVALHSARSQNRRLAALDRFKSGAVPVLVATDVASRGLDIPTVDLVINYDIPRSGAWLRAVSFCVRFLCIHAFGLSARGSIFMVR